MKAVILAAGEGKRLKPFTETMPKVMLPIANKPILEYVIESVKNSGINEIIIVIGYKKEVIMGHFKDYPGIKISYVEQEKQLGTAHALLQVKEYIKDDFIVIPGDNIIDQESITNMKNKDSEYQIMIKEHPHPSKYGEVFVEKSILKNIIEKPKNEMGNLISTGIYKFPVSIFNIIEDLTSQGVYALSFIVQYLIEHGKTINVINANLWRDIVYPWDLIEINESIMQINQENYTGGMIEKGVNIKGAVNIGKGSKIYSNCYIVGPVTIGENCEIGPNACIFPSTVIGKNSVIYPFTEVRNSVIMDNVHIGSNSIISHSIIGRSCKIGNNFSSIFGESTIEIDGEFRRIQNIGGMIGEDCIIGSHVLIDPGVIIGRHCKISPMKRITKNITSDSKVM